MTFSQYVAYVYADLYRVRGRFSFSHLIYELLLGEGFKYCFWMRTCAFTYASVMTRYTCYPLCWLLLRHYRFKFGISIPARTRIGPGFYIGHFGTIVVNGGAVIGANCNISQGVTIGRLNRGGRAGVPVIGSEVYIGPGAKILGNIVVGSNVAIGANCVVTKDVPDNAVVVGIPGEVIAMDGARGYVNNTDYAVAATS
jgi:serine O-acetyltransferase